MIKKEEYADPAKRNAELIKALESCNAKRFIKFCKYDIYFGHGVNGGNVELMKMSYDKMIHDEEYTHQVMAETIIDERFRLSITAFAWAAKIHIEMMKKGKSKA